MIPRTLSYARVSTRDQADGGYSLDSQRERAADYARFKSWPAPIHFVDGGVSGRRDSRPGLDALMAAIQSGDVVLTKDITRIGRGGAAQTLGIIAEMERKGAAVVLIDQNIDSSTPTGRMMLTMMAGFSALELEQTRERSMRGRLQAARMGHWPNKSVPYGYCRGTDRKLELNPETAPHARRALEALAGRSLREAADYLNAEGVPATAKGKGRWTVSQVHDMLHTPAYIGQARLQFEGEVFEIPCPRLVSDDLWTRIHGRQSSEGGTPKPATYPLVGHLRCPHGAPYAGITYPDRGAGDSPLRTYHVPHQAKRRYGCKCSARKAELVEQWAREALAFVFENPNDPSALRVLEHPEALPDDPNAAERDEVRQQISNLTTLQVRGQIDLEDYIRLRGELKAREAALSAPMVPDTSPIPAQTEAAQLMRRAKGASLADLLDVWDVHLVMHDAREVEVLRMRRLA